MKLPILLFIISFIVGEEECPNPDKVACVIPGKYDTQGNQIKCSGYACPPCWKKKEKEWRCHECKDIDYNKFDFIDLDHYDTSCERYKKGLNGQYNLVDPAWSNVRKQDSFLGVNF